MTIYFLDLLDVLEIQQSRIELYGGTHGIRDLGLLQSAIAQPKASFNEQFLHTDLYEMAAAYLFHIARNHPFLDGNKRVALATALVFLDFNSVEIHAQPDSLYEITVAAAEGKADKTQIAEYFRTSSVER